MGAGAFYVAYLIRVHGLSVGTASLVFMVVGPMVSAFGALAGGWVSDRLGARDVRWYMWIPALSSILAIPSSIAFVLWPTGATVDIAGMTLLAAPLVLIPASLLNAMYNGPTLAMTQSIARPDLRAQASALTTGSYNLIGMGLGPLVVGLLSDHFEPEFGVESIRYGLLIVGFVHVQGALHNLLAARYLKTDLAAR